MYIRGISRKSSTLAENDCKWWKFVMADRIKLPKHQQCYTWSVIITTGNGTKFYGSLPLYDVNHARAIRNEDTGLRFL